MMTMINDDDDDDDDIIDNGNTVLFLSSLATCFGQHNARTF